MSLINRALDVLPPALVRAAVHRLWPWQEPELYRLDDYLQAARPALDVGAWRGPWTAALARRCPQVHSFEPQPHLAALLRDWAPDHVVIHQVGVGSGPGTAMLSRPDALPGTDGLATLRTDAEGNADGSGERIEVEVVTIDSCDLADVGFMKIDVEGLELAVLTGAEQTINRHRPRLMVEIEQRHLKHPISDVFDWMQGRDFVGWFLRGSVHRSSWHPLTEFNLTADQLDHTDQPKSARYINGFLFVPVEHNWEPPR